MDAAFALLQQTRKNLLNIFDRYSLETLNEIPAGFRNNLYWHAGHVIVTQQLLMYRNSGQSVRVPEAWIDGFRKGTEPTGQGDEQTFQEIKTELLHTVNLAWADYQAGIFADYKPYPTSYGYQINNIEEAVAFNNAHEAMHLGYVLAMCHLV